MTFKPGSLWSAYVAWYLDRFRPKGFHSPDDGLPYLRDHLFLSVLLITFPVCVLAYIPSMTVSVITGAYVIGLFDTIAMAAMAAIFFDRNRTVRSKKNLFSLAFYVLSAVLLLYLGMRGPGSFILLCLSILIALYQGKKAGYIAATLNAVIFMVMLAIAPIEQGRLTLFGAYEPVTWIGVVVNLIAFNLLAVMAAVTLVDRLHESYLKEIALRDQLKKEEDKIRIAKNQAEESDRLKSAFLANMSHEIRSPMNAILGFASVLSEPGLDTGQQQQYLQIIRRSGTRLVNLINSIIDISKIEAGATEARTRLVPVNKLIDDLCDLLSPDADEKKITLTVKKRLPDDEVWVYTDGDKLNVILTNLVSNAIKYTDAGSVEFGYEAISANDGQQGKGEPVMVFFVADTGIGIAEDRQEAIFERFVQADLDDTDARQGAGLGLSIAKAYVELLEGKIWLNSKPGKGSVFRFSIPYLRGKPPVSQIVHTEKRPATEEESGRWKILLVEDDENSRVYLARVIQKYCSKLEFARTGTEAVKLFLDDPDFDLILLDIRIPELNGYEVAQWIRNSNKQVVIIAQTAYGFVNDRNEAIKAGCNDYIAKPVSGQDLLAIIRKYLG
jgi:signal transduction histidine kinase